MECRTRHDVDEERSNLVEAVKDERVTPHDNSDGIVSVGETVCGHKEALGRRKDPNRQQQQEVDEVAEIGEEVVVATPVVGKVANGHEVE